MFPDVQFFLSSLGLSGLAFTCHGDCPATLTSSATGTGGGLGGLGGVPSSLETTRAGRTPVGRRRGIPKGRRLVRLVRDRGGSTPLGQVDGIAVSLLLNYQKLKNLHSFPPANQLGWLGGCALLFRPGLAGLYVTLLGKIKFARQSI